MLYPPGPVNLNAYLGLTWRHWWMFIWNPLGFVTRLGASYGDLAFYRVFNKRIYLLNRPEWIRKVLVEEADKVVKLPSHMRILSRVFGQGLIASQGNHWRQQRRMMQHGFTSEHNARYVAISETVFRQRLQEWTPNPTFPIELMTQVLLIDATVTALFGVRLPDEQIMPLALAINGLSQRLSQEMWSLFCLPDWLPLPSKIRKRQHMQVLRDAVLQIVTQGRNVPSSGNLYDLLLRSSTHQATDAKWPTPSIVDEITTMLVASSHTTASAMAWMWHCLMTHPEVQTEIRKEMRGSAASVASLEGHELPYTDCVVREVLRLYPPAWSLFARLVLQDIPLGPYTLPKGAWVTVYPYVTHRDERYFVDPLRFDPGRFSPQRVSEIPKHAYFPFGVGPHTCVGASLASRQMALLTGLVLNRFELRLPHGRNPSEFSGTKNQLAHIANRPKPSLTVDLRWADPVPAPGFDNGHSQAA